MTKRRLAFLVIVFVFLTGTFLVNAQDDVTPIGYGERIEGEVRDSQEPLIYAFDGQGGDNLVIEALSDDIDTYLYVLDADGNILGESDDYSERDLNPYLEFNVPARGTYFIAVFGYTEGEFTVQITVTESGDAPATPDEVSGEGDTGKGDVFTGALSDDVFYEEFPLTVEAGDNVIVDAVTTSGDLDLYLILYRGDIIIAENDDRSKEDTNPRIEYPDAKAGEYTLVVTRYGFEQGESSGEYEVNIQTNVSGTTVLGTQEVIEVADPEASGYPVVVPADKAEWTILAYLGGDNNLEDGLLNDMDEFEIAGGSTDDVRIVVLMDRSAEYDDSNGDWDDTRVYEIGADVSNDALNTFPPTFDTSEPLANLGELDTSYANNLLDFLVWGIKAYPAEHYAIILNDHGGAWSGIVTDETTGYGILSIRDLREVFGAALEQTGTPKFDLLVNDACLMSSVEYYASVSDYFDYVISSPEVTLNPGFDMTLLTRTLNNEPNIALPELGQLVVEKYFQDMERLSPDTAPLLGAVATDLRQYDSVVNAVENFAGVVNANPDAYGTLLGRVRANVYTYSFFLPEDEFGPATNIDVGDFMGGIIHTSNDVDLVQAAQDVLDAMQESHIFGIAGSDMGAKTSYYNIYFPSRGSDFESSYFQLSPLEGWSEMLSNYYNSVSATGFRLSRSGAAAPTFAPSVAPSVNITNIYPATASVAFPIGLSMEVVGRNVSEGKFTVDQIQSDGTAVRLDTARIITPVVVDGVVEQINLWKPGVDDYKFTWDVLLPVVTDGTVTNFELVPFSSGVTSLAGRYRFPGAETWLDVSIIFDDDGNTASVLSRQTGGTALAPISPKVGGEFQTYRSIVTTDGRVSVEPGTLYTWPEDGLRWYEAPAPSGKYNLGFLIEAFGGVTGFDSVNIMVDNESSPEGLRGYIDRDWGFQMLHPSDWFDVSYFPDSKVLQTGNLDNTEYMFVYPVDSESGDLEAIANDVLDRFNMNIVGELSEITVDSQDALQFDVTYENDNGKFDGRAYALYLEDLQLGLVFSVETLDGQNLDSLYQLLLDNVTFFDAAEVEARDTGVWTSDFYTTETRYPVPKEWMPGYQQEDGLWWIYAPGGGQEGDTFAGVTVLVETEREAPVVLDSLLAQSVEDKDDYELIGRDLYYGEYHTWQVAFFTHDDGDITGRMYVTVIDNVPYALWFEVPTEDAADLFSTIFDPMLDGFQVTESE